jgi:hypothetical protein
MKKKKKKKKKKVLVMAADVSRLLQQFRNYTTHSHSLLLLVVINAILMFNENATAQLKTVSLGREHIKHKRQQSTDLVFTRIVPLTHTHMSTIAEQS